MKRTLNSGDLKKLMRQKQEEHKSTQKISSPLAKYTSTGQLTCVVCRVPIKSDLLWTAHVVSRQHKDNVSLLRERRDPGDKRGHDAADLDPPPSKRSKDAPEAENSTVPARAALPLPTAAPKKGILKNSRPLIASTCLQGSKQTSTGASRVSTVNDVTAKKKAVPVDFFDNPVARPVEEQRPSLPDHPESSSEACGRTSPMDVVTEQDNGSKSELPEGFFDDPVADAKARKVEYRDPIEEEWERFQREMQSEVTASDQILDEDQQENTLHRQLDDTEEQIRNLSRVVDADRKKRQLYQADASSFSRSQQISAADSPGEDDCDDGEDVDLEDLLDWRSKSSWK